MIRINLHRAPLPLSLENVDGLAWRPRDLEAERRARAHLEALRAMPRPPIRRGWLDLILRRP